MFFYPKLLDLNEKVVMTYQHLSQTVRYQIYILMKDGKTKSLITTLLNRHKSTISRELTHNTGNRGYRPKQACLLAEERSSGSRNAAQITTNQLEQSVDCLLEQWCPVQIANHFRINHETIYSYVYAYKTAGCSLY
jgi:IS30 family transposase